MKIAVFGGAFDPLHSQHVRIITDALSFVDKLILLPSFNPPHKEENTCKFDDRVNMLARFTKDYQNIEVDLTEQEMGLENSYSYMILPRIKQKYGENEYYFLIGGDSIVNFEAWKNPKEIINAVTLVAYKRKPFDKFEQAVKRLRETLNARIIVRDFVGDEVSSSVIKAMLMLECDVSNYLPNCIFSYIRQHNLYCKYQDIIGRLKALQGDKLFEHSVSTTIYAIRLNGLLGLDFDKVFLASLLHDVAKNIEPQKAYENVHYKVVHQFEGKLLASQMFGIKDQEILDAIEYHTTGKANMSNLGMLVYAADKLEPNRSFDGIEQIRKQIFTDFNKGFCMLVQKNIQFILAKNLMLDDLTASLQTWYNLK